MKTNGLRMRMELSRKLVAQCRAHRVRSLPRETKIIKHDRYFAHGLVRRKFHEMERAHEKLMA